MLVEAEDPDLKADNRRCEATLPILVLAKSDGSVHLSALAEEFCPEDWSLRSPGFPPSQYKLGAWDNV
ncbi:hypothetical protein AV530_009035 [Patagioenas fasciata monilis]|uniref:Uncharacterized protein n=1 Tax=Patagioenas fasciata monilis TaxID=372326 RepID=A0A1V4KSI1_PATFA|nr:hypothetical protein AV530_009035 [Patagioenas fasciata monilis]